MNSFAFRFCALLATMLGVSLNLFGQSDIARSKAVHFRAVDIFLDTKARPLAAYQLQFAVTNGNAKIVGIEGGEHPAFTQPPFYDPKAMQQERVIIAAFSTNTANKLPTGKTRIATIHLQIGESEPAFELKLEAAADSQGMTMPITPSIEDRKKP